MAQNNVMNIFITELPLKFLSHLCKFLLLTLFLNSRCEHRLKNWLSPFLKCVTFCKWIRSSLLNVSNHWSGQTFPKCSLKKANNQCSKHNTNQGPNSTNRRQEVAYSFSSKNLPPHLEQVLCQDNVLASFELYFWTLENKGSTIWILGVKCFFILLISNTDLLSKEISRIPFKNSDYLTLIECKVLQKSLPYTYEVSWNN